VDFVCGYGDFEFEVIEHRAQAGGCTGSTVAGGIVERFVYDAVCDVVVSKEIPLQTRDFHVPLALQGLYYQVHVLTGEWDRVRRGDSVRGHVFGEAITGSTRPPTHRSV
jgi:hypothetical protein